MTVVDHVEFCGEEYPLDPKRGLVIGREGDLAIDDNPYLHRHFLRLHYAEGLWWLSNIGSQLSATISDGSTGRQSYLAYLAPAAHLPLVFTTTVVRFSAGSTTYELSVKLNVSVFDPPPAHLSATVGQTTAGRLNLTAEQRLLLVALTETALRSGDRSVSTLPTSAEAAARLGWSITKFNRKLDNVCRKLSDIGVRGLHGGPDQLAANRRFRLVEYALAARLVGADDLDLIDPGAVRTRET